MTVYETAINRRTIRRFKQKPIPLEILRKLVNAGRLAPSSANKQPIEYIIIEDVCIVESVFGTLKWAGYISPAGDPPQGERPVAYIVVLANKEKNSGSCERDAAAAIENMLLVALEEGIGSCWLGAIDTNKLTDILELPEHILHHLFLWRFIAIPKCNYRVYFDMFRKFKNIGQLISINSPKPAASNPLLKSNE